jgi:hypothetical protein
MLRAILGGGRPGGPEEVGTPLRQRSTMGGAFWREAGGLRLGAVAGGTPAQFTVFDLSAETPRPEREVALTGIAGAWAVVRAPAGEVYVGGYDGGRLWRVAADGRSAADLGPPVPGEKTVWCLTLDQDGTALYGGGFPSGRVFRLALRDGAVRAYDRLVPEDAYVRAIAWAEGFVYAGVGTARPALVRLDPDTGRSEVVLAPSGRGSIGTVAALDGFVLAVYGGVTHVLRAADGAEVDRLPAISSLALADDRAIGGDDSRWVYVRKEGPEQGVVEAYRPAARERAVVARPAGMDGAYLAAEQAHTLAVDRSAGRPEPDVVAMDGRAHLHRVVPDGSGGGTVTRLELAVPEAPEPIESLGPGPEAAGGLYLAGYLAGDAAVVGRDGQIRPLGSLGQAEAIASVAGCVYFGTYPGGAIWRYDPAQPWQFGPRLADRRNPRRVGGFGPAGERPVCLAAGADGRLYAGTVPAYGTLGGALGRYDPATDRFVEAPSPVPDQAPIAVCWAGGALVVGTSRSGGLGAKPAAGGPELAVVDADSLEVRRRVRLPFPEDWAVDGLAALPDGAVLGISRGHLFRFDPTAGRVTASRPLSGARPAGQGDGYYDWGKSTGIVLGPDGQGYAIAAALAGSLLRVDPNTLAYREVGQDFTRINLDADGRVFLARRSRLFALRPA